jgi:phosphoglycolate phosphatase
MIKLVLFDIDGTLVRTGGAGVKAFARAFEAEFGIADGTERLKFAGRTDVSLVREFFSHHDIEPSREHFDRFFRTYLVCLERIIVECEGEICPGIPETLESLRKAPHAPLLGLLTGNLRRGAEIKLSHYKLWHEFTIGGFADDHEERDHIAAIAARRGGEHLKENLRGEEVLVIGDTPLDIRCARAIGAKVLAVGTGGVSLEELNQHAPDWAAADLRQADMRAICGLPS